MFCEKCGQRLSLEAKFCTRCGAGTEPMPTSVVEPLGTEEFLSKFGNVVNEAVDVEETPVITEETVLEGVADAAEQISEGSHPDESAAEVDVPDLTDVSSTVSLEKPPITHEEALAHLEGIVSEDILAPIDTDISGLATSLTASDTVPPYSYADDAVTEYIAEDTPSEAVPPIGEFEFSDEINVEVIPQETVKVSGGRKVGAVAVAFFTIVFLLTLNLILSIRFGTTEGSIASSVENVDMGKLLSSKYSDSQTLLEYLYGELDEPFIRNFSVREENLEGFLLNSNPQEYFSEKLDAYAQLIITGKAVKSTLDGKDVADFVDRNRKTLRKEFVSEENGPYNPTAKDLISIERDFNNSDTAKLLVPKEWKDRLGFDFRNTYIGIWGSIGLLTVFSVMSMIWIFFILRKRAISVLANFGTVFTLVGTFTLLISAGIMLSHIFGLFAVTVIGTLLKPAFVLLVIFGGIQLLVGIALINIRRILKRKEIRPLEETQPVQEIALEEVVVG